MEQQLSVSPQFPPGALPGPRSLPQEARVSKTLDVETRRKALLHQQKALHVYRTLAERDAQYMARTVFIQENVAPE